MAQALPAPAPDPARTTRSQSPVRAVAGWALGARPVVLLRLAQAGLGGAALVLVLDWRRWPVAAALLAAGLLGTWGVVEQAAEDPHSGPITLLEGVLVGLGLLLAAAAGFGLFFWILGPAPTF